jgi:hypothetical protein
MITVTMFESLNSYNNGSFVPSGETAVTSKKESVVSPGEAHRKRFANAWSLEMRVHVAPELADFRRRTLPTIDPAPEALADEMNRDELKFGKIREACAAWRV